MTKPDTPAHPFASRPRRLSWRVPVRVEEVPETGRQVDRHVDLTAPEAARAEIAALAGLRTLDSLEAAFDLSRRGDGLQVRGRVQARVGQTCVVTLEPLDNTVDETVDLVFSPSAAPEREAEVLAADGDPDSAEPPEPLEGGAVDLAAVAVEFLMLGVDPYPRKPGARFEPAAAGEADAPAPHPFAALAALKRRTEGEGD